MTVSRIGDAKVCVVLLGGDIATWGPLDLRGQGLKVRGDGLALKKYFGMHEVTVCIFKSLI